MSAAGFAMDEKSFGRIERIGPARGPTVVETRSLPMGNFVEDARPELDIVARAAQGEKAAVTALYDRHHSEVRALVLRLLGDEATAEDVVLDVFVQLPRLLSNFEGRSSVKTYILSSAINLARRQVRSAARRRAAVDRYAAERQRPELENPEEQHARRQLAGRLQRALDTLSMEQRSAFVLCVVEERTSSEAAEILGVPEGTVRTRIFHAKKNLRAFLESEGAQ